ncbi:SufD family Fe-S cluster assembly protein [archaeon]|nr:SufD family Fe-S cluster assembly protein [archaeon]NCP78998.1 SufD family Fe-S cluster assembly protein [archaeon]NCP97619.1 SufD family Fe-S cluster assembly protein [archaeon]NCQ06765.1 SufD family Fe-S cluster assembly protein [archaeon]NCQ50561.1 SufD family Fe-S cluster assembly protein [archaeon]
MFLKINLNNYKLKQIFKSILNTLDKLNLSNYSDVYLIDDSIKDFSSFNISSIKNNSLIIFNKISNKNLFEISDFKNLKHKNIIYYFQNTKSLNLIRNFKVNDFSYDNNFILDKSIIYISNLYFDLNNLKYNQETFIKKDSQLNQNDVLLLSKSEKAYINIRNNHLYKETISNTTIKNVLKNKSFSRYDGMINILKSGDFSKAYLETNSMLLSDTSRSISVPMLEIVPKNVKATHAATVEHVTDEQLFYLSSRSLSKKNAYNLMVSSFLKANISFYPEKIINYIEKKIKDKL